MDASEQELVTQPEASPAAAAGNGAGDLRDQVTEALRNVHDPELGINIVDLGLVYDVRIEGDTVHIDYTLTTMGCPIGPMIEEEIKRMLEPIEGIDQVEAEMTLTPPWTPEKMSEEAKAALGMF
jgi:metal-sulfur cluster biosynthetic enzyme